MDKIFVVSDNMISSLGFTTNENLDSIRHKITGIKICADNRLSVNPFYASLVDSSKIDSEFSENISLNPSDYTRFEKLALLSAHTAIRKTNLNTNSDKTLFILSTTKGNINLLEEGLKDKYPAEKLCLWNSARLIKQHFNNPNEPLVISNACISGLLAILTGYRLIKKGLFESVVVIGCDILSEFVVSGFQSFQSLSPGPCKPFDADRNGLSLGEGAGTVILSSLKNLNTYNQEIIVSGGASSNDANHISGPSRTGEGLFLAISKVMSENNLAPDQIDFISAHGTATPYNDEMETQALFRCALTNTPVNSLKGYFGHTLGAAGVLESIAGIHSILNNELYPTAGFENLGVTEKINVLDTYKKAKVDNCLKLASGFGGCNAALFFKKNDRNQ